MSFTMPQVPPLPDTHPAQTLIGRTLIDAMGPWMTLHLAWYCDAIGAQFEQVARLVLDQGQDGDSNYVPGYGRALDPTLATGAELQYLGQFIGVEVPDGLSDEQARTLILAEGGFHRGTPSSIIGAAKRFLAGTQSVTLIERYGPGGADAYWFTVVVRSEELLDLAALRDAIALVKPGGVLCQVLVLDGYTWAEAIHQWQQDAMSWTQTQTIQP